jgi:hypothetical protein
MQHALHRFRRLFCWALLVAAASMPLSAQAGWTTPGKVTYLNQWSAGFAFALSSYVASCQNGSNQIFIDWNTSNSKQLYAMLLLAYARGDQVAANVDCAGGAPTTHNIDMRP